MKAQKGFTLIELMIVVAIVGILAAVAIPSYQNYAKKAAYTEVLAAMASVKTAVGVCVAQQGTVADCDTAAKVGATLPSGNTAGAVNTIAITATTAAITATPNAYKGILATDTCSLAPAIAAAGAPVTWTYTGVCVTNGYVKN
ncbi:MULTISPECIES: pilin [Pseudomonas syringae group]|uniref:pilin n=1 Tax=Pseudomonas syringae group TaxID=136849 RepID=UPI0001CC21CA|nr:MULTISPECIES: prepilin-type N-terminal cleavage/methylation domain-containing protein [Pseudomonas syringae group]EGH02072.1 type IV pilus biogenesis protein [Pseudomonas amygdali pv. aesculi str. 0893_23]KPX89349.1 Type IV pilus bioproteinsis protein [Pseudomonas amygdali pv. myricae]KWS18914.1 pilus assembly protein [Pseudomonas amygdali pv. ulmi]KWS31485.1 pilus assembly protein [Pseudomonas syringae pv. rhaphiolepidis]KWS49128.1 pilus assembly protein [Pseudomonas amygdali pv. myricae]